MKPQAKQLLLLSCLISFSFFFSCKHQSRLVGLTEGTFQGIEEIVEGDSIVNILIVHGIGPTKSLRYADPLVARIIESWSGNTKLKNSFKKKAKRDSRFSSVRKSSNLFGNKMEELFQIDTLDLGSSSFSSLVIYQFPKDQKANTLIPQKKIRFFATYWSNLTDAGKQELVELDFKVLDGIEKNTSPNANIQPSDTTELSINHFIKQFIVNQAFTDLLQYFNPTVKPKIQQAVVEGMKLMSLTPKGLNDFIHSRKSIPSPNFAINQAATPRGQINSKAYAEYNTYFTPEVCLPQHKSNKNILIGRSFGSRVLFDVLTQEISSEDSLFNNKVFTNVCGQESYVYLMPHQLPLINLGLPNNFLSQPNEHSKKAAPNIVQLVSYLNIHDILSFYKEASEHNPNPINVSIRNNKRKYSLKKFITRSPVFYDPYQAHENYPENPFVIHSILAGIKLKDGSKNPPFTFTEINLKKTLPAKDIRFLKSAYKINYRRNQLPQILDKYQAKVY